MDPYKFLFDCREKVSPLHDVGYTGFDLVLMHRQYGDLFTFVLLGRKMTVALGPKGNNLILGGRLNQVSAEEAYTVSL